MTSISGAEAARTVGAEADNGSAGASLTTISRTKVASMAGAETDIGGADASATKKTGAEADNDGEGASPKSMTGAETLLSSEDFLAKWPCKSLQNTSGPAIARTVSSQVRMACAG